LKVFSSSGKTASRSRRDRAPCPDRAQALDQIGAGVGGHQDDGVLEVDVAAFAVLHRALVEDLIEDVLHAGMGLFHLVQQHDAVGLAADGLGQHAAFAVADVAGRRAHQQRDLVLFLELGHVDHGHVLLAAVQQVGQRDGGFRLADAAGAASRKTPIGVRGSARLARDVRMLWR
jgi:hypothetical protein